MLVPVLDVAVEETEALVAVVLMVEAEDEEGVRLR